MANRLYNKQVSPKGYMKGGRVNKMGGGMMKRKMFSQGPAKPKRLPMTEGEIPKELEKIIKENKPRKPIRELPLKKEPIRKPPEIDRKKPKTAKPIEPKGRMKRRENKTSENKKPRINKIKDKLDKVGNMKVKDAAKAVAKGAMAATPIGLAKKAADKVTKNFKFQSPIVRKNRKFGGKSGK